jgi:hypothetical protein
MVRLHDERSGNRNARTGAVVENDDGFHDELYPLASDADAGHSPPQRSA